MKFLFCFFVVLFVLSCSPGEKKSNSDNPLLSQWNTPSETPPFSTIQNEHFKPAFIAAMDMEKKEIQNIIDNKEKPDFNNTIKALEKSGKTLDRVNAVFSCLKGANTNSEIQTIAQEMTPLLSKHSDDINLNPKLFEKIKFVYDNQETMNCTVEEKNLLKNIYLDFVRSGADLSPDKQEILRGINEELSVLGLKFSDNLLHETNAVGLIIDNPDDLAGLPDNCIQGAADLAKAKGYEGKWVFTLQKPSFIPFLQYSEKRELREKLFKGYINRGNNQNEFNNNEIIAKIASLRVKKANLLGYDCHADFVLERNMAKNSDNVLKFLHDLWEPAVKRAEMEAADMNQIIRKEGKDFPLEAWDWWYYAEKLKKEKYNLDEEMLRPYFQVDNVLQGAFHVANQLYGITFTPRNDIDTYHDDAQVFEVKEADGKHIGIFYCDYFPRDSKRSGAWSSGFRGQSNIDGNWISPLVFNVGNFSKPTADKPALLSLDEVETLFHELGHGLDALLSNTVYSGSRRVPRDFVELPSQIMENWAFEPTVLKSYAKHYETGEAIPDDLIEKIVQSGLFNQGFATVEYLAASFLDMEWHMLKDTTIRNTPEFEKNVYEKIGLIPEIESRYQSTNFAHIVGGYSAGYYSYIWAEVLDADAFAAFKETELFNQELADKFRKHVLAVGGTEDCMELYKRFRGKEPDVNALLKNRGLLLDK